MRLPNITGNELLGAIRRSDPVAILAGLFVLFVGLLGEPWWTLTGYNNSSLLNVKISPYNFSISATGMAQTSTILTLLGSIARILTFSASILFIVSGLRPLSWWRNITYYLALSSVSILYLILVLMIHIVQISFLTTYNVVLPYSGSVHLPANILGLDMKYYSNPIVTANFSFPFYLGLLTISLPLGMNLIRKFQYHLAVLQNLIMNGIGDIQLSPPYHHVWLASHNPELNPLMTDPVNASESELLVSFEKMYETVGPGGSVSIILPAWATNVEDRFQKLIPLTGFQPESSGIIYRTPGIPETELRYRKPSEETKERDIVPVAPNSHEENRPVENITKEYPFSREETNAQPSWHSTVHGHLDGIITKTALKIITQRQEAIPYRELLNQVYLDLVDRKIDFESSRQIETVLLAHAGSELEIVEENDPTHGRLIRKWSLGERRMRIPTDTAQGWISRGGGKVRRSMSKLKMFGRRSRYHRRRQKDEDQ